MRLTGALTALPSALLAGLAAVSIYLLSIAEFIGLRPAFVLLTLLLLIYLGLEISRVRRLHPVRWLINPAVLCSLMTFMLGFGITNLLYFLPEDSLSLLGVLPEVTASMTKLMLMVVIGALAMWLGYWSPLAARLTIRGSLVGFRTRFFKFNAEPKAWVLPGLVSVSLASRLIQVRLGVFGYSSEYDRLIELASYTQYLAMGASLGKLALVVAALQYYSPQLGRRAGTWFFGILAYEIMFGLLSGFKSAVVLPFVIVLVCQYLRLGRISRHWLIAILPAMMIAFAVIEPFRAAKNEDTGFKGTSVASIVNTMTGSTSSANDVGKEEKASFLLSVMGRSNLTYVGSLGISFADDNENLPEGSPAFLGDILLAPVHAWIPRFLWEGKRLGNIGLWYTQTVMGFDFFSSTAMGLFTYLYFAGGMIVVFGGLFLIGFVQRVLFFITQPWISAAGGIVFMSMLTTTAVIAESAFNEILVSLYRDLPLVLILTAFLYRRASRIAVQ